MSTQVAFLLGVLFGVGLTLALAWLYLLSFASVRAEDQDV